MKIGIVGWGLEGQSAYKYFGPNNDYLIVNEAPPTGLPAESDKIEVQFLDRARTPGLTGNVDDLSYLNGIENCDTIIYSVTAAKNLEKKFGKDQKFWSKAKTTQHLFFEVVKTQNIIGVTGTKGKGTTSTLIYELLKAGGKQAWLGGNIGTPVLDFVNDVKPNDWVVLELSNFQLYNLTYSPRIAVCLMISTEHMDWHPDMADYIEAKTNLFRHQKSDDTAIYMAGNEYSEQIASHSPGKKIPYYKQPGVYVREDGMIVHGKTEIISKTEVKMLGEHNLQNVCAACTVVFEATGDLGMAKAVISNFSGLEHRLEFVREYEGVNYYDDSFGTTPETTITAMEAFAQPKIMVLGGHDKGVPFDDLADEVAKSNVRHVITIGLVGPKIAELLKTRGFNSITEGPVDMDSIVNAAKRNAQSGDVVLLSCGTSSFGLFKDYKERGDLFKQAVLALA